MFLDFIKGFRITIGKIFTKPVTLEYPEVKREDPPWFRGRHHLQRYENGLERCVGCCLCAAVCPSEAIYIEAAENDPEHPVSAGERYAQVYQIHQLRCIWCGFCAEACPEDAIKMGPNYELANYERTQFICDKDEMLDSKDQGIGDPPDLKVNSPL